MKRTLVLVSLTLLALITLSLFSAVFNAPRMLDTYADIETARAHQAAAEAMQTQAKTTNTAVLGMVCLAGVLGFLVVGGLLLAVWFALAHGRNALSTNTALPYPAQPNRRRLQPSTQPLYQPPTPPTVWLPTADFDWQSWTWPEDEFPPY
jgi:hypothetical protein